MKNKTLLIVGKGEQARIIEEIVKVYSLYSKVKYLDLGTDLPKIKKSLISKCDVFVAVGNNRSRQSLYRKISNYKIPFASIIHPTAYLAKSVKVKKNVFIGAKAVINSGTTLEKGVYVNTGCIVEHDNHIGEFSHLTPGVITGGGTIIGKGVFAGLASILIDHIKIADNIIIGAGSVVTKSFLKKNIKLLGVPARIKQ